MSLNKVMLIGRLGRDPEIKNTQSGAVVCTLAVATDESYKGPDGNKVEKTEWHRCIAFANLADVCQRFLHKGSLVYVEGTLTSRSWEDQNGQKHSITEIKMFKMEMLDSRKDGGQQNGQQGFQPQNNNGQQYQRPQYQPQSQPQQYQQGNGYGGSGNGRPSENDEIPF